MQNNRIEKIAKEVIEFEINALKNLKNNINFSLIDKIGSSIFYKKLYKLTSDRPSWNFHKYLITPEGDIKSFSHRIDPEDDLIVSAIQDSINL